MSGQNDLQENEAGDLVEVFREEFDFDSLDTLEDMAREALANGTINQLVRSVCEREVSERSTAAVAAVVCLIAESRRPKLLIDQIAYATGMSINQGISITALARKHKQTKQAFSQGALRLARLWMLRPSRQMRSLKARESMAKAFAIKQKPLQKGKNIGNGFGTQPQL